MLQRISVPILLFVVFFSCTRYAGVTGSTPTWQENFDQPYLDTTKWSKIPRGPSDWNRKMSPFDSCYDFRDGKLILRGIVNYSAPDDTSSILTGGVFTKGKVSFGYGRLEIRAKLQGARGAWPAIWMLPKENKWPKTGEIDIMERLNYDTFAYQTVHTHYTHALKIGTPRKGGTGSINPNAFNTYAVEKYADSLVFFINDRRTFAYPRSETDAEGQWPFNEQEFYLLIDMQVGGNWVGKPDVNDLPVEMEIDWVRFYRFSDKKAGGRRGK